MLTQNSGGVNLQKKHIILVIFVAKFCASIVEG